MKRVSRLRATFDMKGQFMTLPTKQEHIERYNRLPSYARALVEFPSLQRFVFPSIPTITGILGGTILSTINPIAGVVVLLSGFAGSGAYLHRYLQTIAPKDYSGNGDDEPSFGQLQFLGSRLPVVVGNGLAMGLPFGKFVERSAEQFNQDITIESTIFRLDTIPADEDATLYETVAKAFKTPAPADVKVGGSVKITIGITFELDWTDGHAMLDLDEVGEMAGAIDIINDAIESDLRELGRRMPWFHAAFATDLMSAHLISRLTGEKIFERKGIFTNPTPDSITKYLENVRINGRSYVSGLGLRIRRLEVKSVDPIGKLKDAAEKAAIELLNRQALQTDMLTTVQVAKATLAELNDGSMTFADIMQYIAINDENARAEMKIFDMKSIDKLADAVKMAFTRA